MAVDNEAKRLSVIALAGRGLRTLPIPDGSIGQGDRSHLVRLFSGIAATPVPGFEIGTVPSGINPNPSAIPTLTPQVFMVIEDL